MSKETVDRLMQIDRCMLELELARRDRKTNPQGAMMSEMDWIEELHYRLYA